MERNWKIWIKILNQYMTGVDALVDNKSIDILMFFWDLQKVLKETQKFDDNLFLYYDNTMYDVTNDKEKYLIK
jgi:hypothetical protein